MPVAAFDPLEILIYTYTSLPTAKSRAPADMPSYSSNAHSQPLPESIQSLNVIDLFQVR